MRPRRIAPQPELRRTQRVTRFRTARQRMVQVATQLRRRLAHRPVRRNHVPRAGGDETVRDPERPRSGEDAPRHRFAAGEHHEITRELQRGDFREVQEAVVGAVARQL